MVLELGRNLPCDLSIVSVCEAAIHEAKNQILARTSVLAYIIIREILEAW
jgi:hypothetical protein